MFILFQGELTITSVMEELENALFLDQVIIVLCIAELIEIDDTILTIIMFTGTSNLG